MDPLRLSIALGPLALYLLAIGMLHRKRTPTVVTGSRDLTALALGVSGLVTIGPAELLLPQQAIINYGPLVWGMVAVVYSLCVSLVVLNSRQRLVIYHAPALAEFRPIVAQVIEELDPESRWAGSTLLMPRQHVELSVEIAQASNTIVLQAVHEHQNHAAWALLHAGLARRLAAAPHQPNAWGYALPALGAALLALVAWQLTQHPAEVTQALFEMLRLTRGDAS
ncbi:MAG: hypothetical protein JSS27_03095 [Planctomycetes bacterium]|nr:hypothetical protein [Planctomycetota bacterium]